MSDILAIAVSALRADQTKLEQLSLNAANATTPGYRRGVMTSVSFGGVMDAQQQAQVHTGSTLPATPLLRRSTDLTAGALNPTGHALDVAVEGGGFLALTDGNRTWLTRAGALKVSDSGDLVGANGLRVLGSQGDIRPGTATDIAIDPSGHVKVAEQPFGQLRLVKPTEGTELVSADGVLFEVGNDQFVDVAPNTASVRSGFLEASNTSGLQEMLGVMEGTRHFESLIRLVQGYDEVLGKAIQKLGEV